MRRKRRVVVVLFLATVSVAGRQAPAHATDYTGWFDFAKNKTDQWSSTLSWRYGDGETPAIYSLVLARAGSGVTTNDCEVGKGWLPNGLYDQRQTSDSYNGTKIWGRVWQVSDKRCSNGTYRTELFIHTEETSSRTQACSSSTADSPQCWEGAGDYRSYGCIKVAWSADGASVNIAYAHRRYHDGAAGGYSGHVRSIPYILQVR